MADKLTAIIENFTLEDAERVKAIERTTNHDVKAVEYYLKEEFDKDEELKERKEFLHFTCTSEDINNLAYAMMVDRALKEILLPQLETLISKMDELVHSSSDVTMMGRTHGQSATPTTMGKEIANFVYRVNQQMAVLKSINPRGKFNGATGNFNAHVVAYPDIDWEAVSSRFVTSLGLEYNPYSTQIEQHDWIAQISN